MKYLLLLLVLLSPQALTQDCIILLHGLARTSHSMDSMANALTQQGYFVVNHDYPSRQYNIKHLAINEIPNALQGCPHNMQSIHFVTHSLGGILVRYYLSENSINALGRVVMLGPPNQGSEVVDRLKNMPGFNLMNGLAGNELGTDPQSVPRQLGPADFDLGIIAGNRTINFILSQFLTNPDDGKVSVASTKLQGMADHIIIEASHPFLMTDKQVIRQVLFFIQYGQFKH